MDWTLLYQEWLLFPHMFFTVFSSPSTLLFIVIGSMLGIIVGTMPGLTATMAMSLLLGLTLKLPIQGGLGMMIGIYTSGVFAGGVTAVMLNIPGTPAAAATVLDGFPLAKQGKGREAIGTVMTASFFGEILGESFGLILLPFVAIIAMRLGDWEFFLVGIIGVSLAGALAGQKPLKGLIAGLLGLLFSTVGIETIYAYPRFSYTPELMRGFSFIAIIIGLYGLAEVFWVLRERKPYEIVGGSGRAIINWRILKRNIFNVFRSTCIGIGVGVVPGVGESASCWLSYEVAKRQSKKPETFGKGSFEGLIAAEVSNNATSGGALIPSLVLGIPGGGATAILIAALYIYGLHPGPTLILEKPGFIAMIIALFLISAIVMWICAFLLSGYFIRILSAPRKIILPMAAALGVLGTWAAGFTYFDIYTMLAFGILGYFMRSGGFPVAPMVLGVLVGRIVDTSLRRALLTYSNNLLGMFLRPYSIVLLIIFFFILLSYFLPRKHANDNEKY